MAKGELTILRCMRIADILKAEIGDTNVKCDTQNNTISITTDGNTIIVVRPVSITPVQ